MNLSELTQYNPTPTSFPYDGGDTLVGFDGYPNAISNGFLLDMDTIPKDKPLLERVVSTYPKIHLTSALHYLGDNIISPMPEPSTVEVRGNYLVYVFTHPTTKAKFGIQVRHWNYLRHHYPDCVFLYGKCEHSDIIVKSKEEIVGAVRPILGGN